MIMCWNSSKCYVVHRNSTGSLPCSTRQHTIIRKKHNAASSVWKPNNSFYIHQVGSCRRAVCDPWGSMQSSNWMYHEKQEFPSSCWTGQWSVLLCIDTYNSQLPQNLDQEQTHSCRNYSKTLDNPAEQEFSQALLTKHKERDRKHTGRVELNWQIQTNGVHSMTAKPDIVYLYI
jgi:hypothetical protein